MEALKPGISVVVNTLNEERDLPNALASVRDFADQIVVVDMHSDDHTQEIAREAGAEVFEHERVGYVEPARAFAVSKAKHEWILVLDADEMATRPLAAKLKELSNSAHADIYRLPMQNYLLGAALTGGGYGPNQSLQLRFFRKEAVDLFSDIHDGIRPKPSSKTADLSYEGGVAIAHFNYVSIRDFVDRMNRYTNFETSRRAESSKAPTPRRALRHGFHAFKRSYWTLGGRRDGWRGLYVAVLLGMYSFLAMAKRHELMESGGEEMVLAKYREIAQHILKGV